MGQLIVYVVLSFLATLCTALSTAALLVALRAPARRDTRLTKLEGDVEDAFTRIRRLNGRVAQQKRGIGDDDGDDDGENKQRTGETPDAWKKRMRLKLARGGLTHHE